MVTPVIGIQPAADGDVQRRRRQQRRRARRRGAARRGVACRGPRGERRARGDGHPRRDHGPCAAPAELLVHDREDVVARRRRQVAARGAAPEAGRPAAPLALARASASTSNPCRAGRSRGDRSRGRDRRRSRSARRRARARSAARRAAGTSRRPATPAPASAANVTRSATAAAEKSGSATSTSTASSASASASGRDANGQRAPRAGGGAVASHAATSRPVAPIRNGAGLPESGPSRSQRLAPAARTPMPGTNTAAVASSAAQEQRRAPRAARARRRRARPPSRARRRARCRWLSDREVGGGAEAGRPRAAAPALATIARSSAASPTAGHDQQHDRCGSAAPCSETDEQADARVEDVAEQRKRDARPRA